MVLCGQCKWWKDPRGVDRVRASAHGLVHIAGRENEIFGSCASPKFRLGYGLGEALEDEVVVEDDEGWGFFTGPHFGCVHGEAKNGE